MVDYTLPVVSQTIDGYTYTSTKLPCMPAYRLLLRCTKALGERGMKAIVQRYAAGFADVAPMLVVTSGEVNVYGALFQASYGLQEDPELPRDLLAQCKADKLRPANMSGGDITPHFDAHFSGELPHLFRVLEFVAAHNYLGFTLGLRFPAGALTNAATETDAPSDSPAPPLE